MNRLFLFSLLAAVFASPVSADPVEQEIQSIRERYYATEEAKLKTRVLRLEEAGGTVELIKFYDDRGLLQKMAFTEGGDHGVATSYYYVDRGEIYFVFRSRGSWRFDTEGPEGSTVDLAAERRIYVAKGKVIRHLYKQAETRDAEKLSAKLAKQENESVDMPELEQNLVNAGEELLRVDTEQEFDRFLAERY